MKDLVEPISALLWDSLNSLCLYFQATIEDGGLLVGGIVALLVAGLLAIKSSKNEYGEENLWYSLLVLVDSFSVYGSILCIAWNDFKAYEKANSEYGWIFVSLMLLSTLILVLVRLFNKKIFFFIGFFICLIVSAALLSKFVVGLCIILGLVALGGGSSYVGTFTDKYGNSYDIFKKD